MAPGKQHDSMFGAPERIAGLIVRYHDADLSDAEHAELKRTLQDSAQARDLFVRWGLQMQALGEALSPEYRDDRADDVSADVPAMGVVSDSEPNYRVLLAELAQLEASAQTITLPIDLDEQDEQAGADNKAGSLSAHDLAAVGGYMLRQALTSRAAVYAYAAAVVLLAAVFLIPWGGGEEPVTVQSDNAPSGQDHHGLALMNPVATLTAQRNAVWDQPSGGDLLTGTPLVSGQRLTLTQGFAEITTARGAVATLQAPATIELTDSPNNLHLHAGKLVGLCHTDASKGFTVKTPHGDVVDLGTEFGVNVTPRQITATVFTGEVTLTPTGGQTQPITTNQTARLNIDGNNRRLVVQDQPAKGFDKVHAVALTKTTKLPGTGRGVAVGQVDPNWSITEIDGLAFLKPVYAVVDDPAGYSVTARENLRFLPNDPATSNWIKPAKTFKVKTSVLYQTTFDVTGMDLQTVALDLKFLADQQVTEIAINGRPVAVPAHGSGPAFIEMTELVIREGFVEGPNTLSLTVQRHRVPGVAVFWTGLRAELQLTSQRPSVGPNE